MRKISSKIELLNIAIQAAHYGANEVTNIFQPTIIEYKSSATDLSTKADKAGETAIRSIIGNKRPNDGFLSEEGREQLSGSGLRWVFDPLDGTTNYINRVPHWSISIACEEFIGSSWETIIGVVYDTARQEIFTAVKGEGAQLNTNKILIKNSIELKNALIATGFSYDTRKRILQSQVLTNILPQVRDVRSSGSSALDLCWVALGRWDGFYENELSRWDWSAGGLIVKEAGGKVSKLGTGVLAAPLSLHKAMSTVLY